MTYGARILIGIFVVITIVSVVIGNSNDNVGSDIDNLQKYSYCGNCGLKLDNSARFCPNCGRKK